MNNLELEITSKAYNDMEIISEFIAQDNKTAANKMMELFYINIGFMDIVHSFSSKFNSRNMRSIIFLNV